MKKILELSILPALFSLWCISTTFAQDTSIVGKWKAIDDKTHKPLSVVRIYEKEGMYFGQIEELIRKSTKDPNPVCSKCADDDPRKGQPVIGMVIITDLVEKEGEYVGGTILDPVQGKTYPCKLWIENGNLMVRGYLGFLFRTQTWLRVE